MRLTQSLFDPAEVNLVCYVDDPLAALRGTPLEKEVLATCIVLVWESLNFKLAYQKGQFGHSVDWIGGTLRSNEAASGQK